jgi:hypothetical protein
MKRMLGLSAADSVTLKARRQRARMDFMKQKGEAQEGTWSSP